MRAEHALEVEEDQAEAELGEFSYAVAHDLSTEFRHVAEFSKLLAQDASVENSAAARNAQIVSATAQRCQAKLEAIVIYSLVQRRPMALRCCSAEVLVEKALREAEQEPGAHSALVATDVSGHCLVDEYLMGSALRLAIANALQFAKPGVQLKVAISGGSTADGGWSIRIGDNGVGLAPEYREKAFRMFWQLEPHHPGAGPGSGLAIIRRIVRRHGGEARFLDCAAGACLELRLPGRIGQ